MQWIHGGMSTLTLITSQLLNDLQAHTKLAILHRKLVLQIRATSFDPFYSLNRYDTMGSDLVKRSIELGKPIIYVSMNYRYAPLLFLPRFFSKSA